MASQEDVNAQQAQTNREQALTNQTVAGDLTVLKTDVSWIKKFQWWQLGLNVAQLSAVAIIASKLLGGPGPSEAVAALVSLI